MFILAHKLQTYISCFI